MDMVEKAVINWMALSLMPGLGSRGICQLIERFGNPKRVFDAAQNGQEESGIRKNVLPFLRDPAPFRERAEALFKRLENGGATAVCPDDEDYPELLKEIADPPAVLYVQGRLELLGSLCLAMVGSRAATSYGKRSSYSLAKALASSGVTVVSGLAAGIDSEAHRGALAVSGATIGVLGCGLDVVYPQQNSELYAQIRETGLLLTEYPLGTRPDSYRFPARNRIISGLSRGVVVVEAARKSGSLITAEMALDEGRDVYAVPGQIDSFKSDGAHWLLQQGAKLVQSAEDILVEYTAVQGTGLEREDSFGAEEVHTDPEAQALLQQVDVYPISRDALIACSGMASAKVAELLLLLELDGLIEMLPGDEIRRIG